MVATGVSRSSMVIVAAPPVVMFTTQLERCLITLRKGAKASWLWSGRPSLGSARVQMHDGRAGLRGADRGLRDLLAP